MNRGLEGMSMDDRVKALRKPRSFATEHRVLILEPWRHSRLRSMLVEA